MGDEMFSKIFGLIFAVGMIIVLPLMAGTSDVAGKAKSVTIEGKLVCLGCELKKADGARADCKVYGHKHALKTADGNYVNFLENQYSADLIKGEKYHNKKLVVKGRHFAEANLIDIESFEVDGQNKTWCGHCKAMDGCEKVTSR
jgi:hypothetical protein